MPERAGLDTDGDGPLEKLWAEASGHIFRTLSLEGARRSVYRLLTKGEPHARPGPG